MPKVFAPTSRAAERIAETVRAHERRATDLRRLDNPPHLVPTEFCFFEMLDELVLPQNGPGVARANKLRWDPDASHAGMEYDTFLGIAQGDWAGDLTDVFRPNDPNETNEEIILLDHTRMHSAMATADGDVGKYGVAWKPHDGFVLLKTPLSDSPELQRHVWSIVTMQTPGMFTGSLNSALTTSTASVMVTAFRTNKGSGHVTWGRYDWAGDGWSAANGGLKITAYNLPGSSEYMFEADSGGTVLCKWNMRESRYYIIQAECPLDEEESFISEQMYNG